MNPIQVVKVGSYRWLVTTSCHECFVDVQGSSDKDPKWRYVTMALLSGHDGGYAGTLRQRTAQAWRMLRGTDGRPWMEMVSPEEVDGVIKALTAARDLAFSDNG